MNHPSSLLARSVIAFLLLVLCVAPVQAQGTMGQVSDPMSSQEAAVYLKRYVKPTFEQWELIEDAQDVYLEKYTLLRDGSIADFLKESQKLNRSGGMPNIEEVRKYMESQKRVNGRVRQLDEQFFDSIAAGLRPDQVVGLSRARLARKRTRLRDGIVEQMGMGSGLDLWRFIEKLNLNDEEYQLFLARLQPYEEKSARLLGKASDAGATILLTIVEEIEARGFGDIDFSDPENMTPEIMEEVMAAYLAGYEKGVMQTGAVASQIKELNTRTLRDLTPVVDPWVIRKLKFEYLDRVLLGLLTRFEYENKGEIKWELEEENILDGGTGLTNRQRRTLDIQFGEYVKGLRGKDELLGNVQEPFKELAQAYIMEEHKQLDRLLKVSEEWDSNIAMAEGLVNEAPAEDFQESEALDSETEPTLEEKIAQIQRVRFEDDRQNVEQLHALVDAEGSEELKGLMEEPWKLAKYGDPPAPGDEQVLEIYEEPQSSVDSITFDADSHSWKYKAIGIKIIGKVRQRVGEETWLQAVLENLHEAYLEQWASQIAPLMKQMKETESSIYTWDSETELSEYNQGANKRLQELRVAELELGGRLDKRFFEDLVLAMPEDAADAMRVLHAEREFQNALVRIERDNPWDLGRGSSNYANPIAVLNELEINDEERKLVDQLILKNQKVMIDSQKALQSMQLDNEHDWVEFSWGINNAMTNEEESQYAAALEFQKFSRENQERIQPFLKDVEEKRDTFFMELAASISEELNQQFIVAYRIASYPSIYKDQESAKPALEIALNLASLTPEQKEEISALLATYETKWLEQSHRMAEAYSGTSGALSTKDIQQAWIESNMKLDRARFGRTEVSRRTLRRLARILDTDQRRHVHALRGIEEEIGEEVSPSAESTVNAE